MKKSSFFRSTAAAVMVAGLFAASAAQADDLVMEQDINALNFSATVNGVTDNITAGLFNVSNLTTGNSFLAFCYELLQGVGSSTLNPPGLPFATASANAAAQTLFNQSFKGLDLNNTAEVAGFQIALWETTDDNSLSTGNFKDWIGDDNALIAADLFLMKLDAGVPATGNYNLTVWTNPTSQDLVSAAVAPSNNVPEPATSVLAALGLAGLALARRRKA